MHKLFIITLLLIYVNVAYCFQIYIKTLTGKLTKYDVELNDTIKTIKNKINNKENIPVNNQRLVFNGKVLKDDKTISYYNIQENDIINLVISLNIN